MTEQSLTISEEELEADALGLRRHWIKEGVAPIVTFVFLLALWELVTDYLHIPTWLLPAPSAIAVAFVDWRGELLGHSLVTLYETLVSFALSIALAVPLAVAVVYSPFLRKSIYPILLALQSVPKVAIAPLLA